MNPFCLLTHSSPEYRELANLSEPSKLSFCMRHGLEYRHVRTGPVSDTWMRPLIWQQQLLNSEGFLFMGADTLITNPSALLPISTLRPCLLPNVDLVISVDCGGINDDIFLIESNPRTVAFMQELCERGPSLGGNDQEAMAALLAGFADYTSLYKRIDIPLTHDGCHAPVGLVTALFDLFAEGPLQVRLVPQRLLNAYPQELYGREAGVEFGWQPGDFAMHVPGLPLAQRVERFKAFLS